MNFAYRKRNSVSQAQYLICGSFTEYLMRRSKTSGPEPRLHSFIMRDNPLEKIDEQVPCETKSWCPVHGEHLE